ncbi:MAG: four helix bundle protein [Armatimonadota bacterium]
MKITSHRELNVFQNAFTAAMRIFDLSKRFPREETYSLIDQARRSSRSVAANIAEAWRKRRYEAAFIAKLNDAEAEAAETEVWIEFAVQCDYLSAKEGESLIEQYENILRTLVGMINHPETWILRIKQQGAEY